MASALTAPVSTLTPLGDPLLSLKAVTQRFGGVVAMRDITIDVGGGEIVGVIGPNGAGKTTLFDCIAGVRRPTSGTISFEGREITRDVAFRRARAGIRRTFQRQQPITWLTVEDNVLAAVEWRGGGGGFLADLVALPPRRKLEKSRRVHVERALEVCGLSDLRSKPAGELSIGEARRLELARAIVDRPSLLLLDEPTSGLEESEVEIFASIVRALRDATGCAVLLVEHDVPFVMRTCQRVVVMQTGTILADGTPEAVRADPRVRAAYLGA